MGKRKQSGRWIWSAVLLVWLAGSIALNARAEGGAAAGQSLSDGEAVTGQSLFGGENAAGQLLSEGEAAAGQLLSEGEAVLGQPLSDGEAVTGQPLFGGENAAGQSLSDGEVEAGQLLSEEEAAAARQWEEIVSATDGRLIEVPYITHTGEVESRQIYFLTPKEAEGALPVVYFAHYDITAYPDELRYYLSHGWAVASPQSYDNSQLLGDDLVFNNAALYTVRHLEEIDPLCIAVVGKSAGGYTALMLGALQLGSCAVVAKSPVTNPYFTFVDYLPRAQASYQRVGAELLPAFPAIQRIAPSFDGVCDGIDPANTAYWEAISPIGLTAAYSSPTAIVHFTSDLLVPVDQVTRAYTYRRGGLTMPWGFLTRLPASYPGLLGKSLAELLPAELTAVSRIPRNGETAVELRAQDGVRYQISIYNDGPVESYGAHTSGRMPLVEDGAYLSEIFTRGLAGTEQLSAEKLRLLLRRYQGLSVQLPVRTGVDEEVYGSLTVYRREIVEELALWTRLHSYEALELAVRGAIEGEADAAQLGMTWLELRAVLAAYVGGGGAGQTGQSGEKLG